MNREFLMLAKTYKPDKHRIGGWYMSTKLDGQRAFWDGGVTRGVLKKEVPWANTAKDERYQQIQVATGLWSRYGNVIHAPKWFLDKLPSGICLDGELYMGRGLFQDTRSIVSRLDPDDRWKDISFCVFEMPPEEEVFKSGRINNPQFKEKHIDFSACSWFYRDQLRQPKMFCHTINRAFYDTTGIQPLWLPQAKLPTNEELAREKIFEALQEETRLGGEGLMLRNPMSFWVPKRTANLLKVKPLEDSEAKVVGYVFGKGKYKGMLGALIVEWNGQKFNLSGMTDDERRLYNHATTDYAAMHYGEVSELDFDVSATFRLGSTVSFQYQGLTDAGVPRIARYWRK
jgi:DNA ligase-1